MLENSSKDCEYRYRGEDVVVWGDLPDPRHPDAPLGVRTEVFLERSVWNHIFLNFRRFQAAQAARFR